MSDSAIEIARLHGVNDRLRAEIERLRAMVFRPATLTDAEREAVERAAKFADDAAGYCQHADNAELARKNAAILRGLLDRTATVEK